ncbi:GGDEF domain-containing protein [Streptomyces sp. NPDC020917]|uniref:GGDEF domain-containing protein n=1 Tax=Streptomyces sp. NPDC020917 TaxID=3365102 RepID=UPI00378B5EF5
MSAVLTAAAVAGPLAAGWPLHAWRLRRRLDTARHDPLSGLLTRAPFEERAARLLDTRGVSAVLVDLDGFKALNDTHGHAAGDAAIRATGARLNWWMQINSPGVCARLGGDEFAAVLHTLSTAELSWAADELHRALAEPITYEGRDLPIGASVGAVRRPPGVVVDLPGLLRRADEAMYFAKGLGGGSCVSGWHDPQHPTTNGRRAGRPGTGEPHTRREVA